MKRITAKTPEKLGTTGRPNNNDATKNTPAIIMNRIARISNNFLGLPVSIPINLQNGPKPL